jgi:DNA repair exonuclease SbcCD ATPase subunit
LGHSSGRLPGAVNNDFEAGLARMQRALAQEEDRRASRRALKRARRAERRRRNPGAGVGMLLGAMGIGAAVVNGAPYWLLFLAVWMAFAGIRRLVGRRDTSTVEGEVLPEVDSVDARMARVDDLCDQLLADIQSAPAVLREVVHRPEETVRALRDGVHALERREREIRDLARPEDDARLQSEREGLQQRLAAEQDAVTRQRLTQALEALDRQRVQRASLVTAASRLDAERTRLLYTLEELHTQVRAVRSTAEAGQEAVAVERLREGLDTLSSEVSAVASALESVQAVDPGVTGSSEQPAAGRSSVAERS